MFVVLFLLGVVASGGMPAGERLPYVTQRDVAQALKVDQSTVSRALSDDHRIPKKHRIEIQTAAREFGYVPNPAAFTLASYKRMARSKPVCAELAWINARRDPETLRARKEFDCYWQGAAAGAEKLGYRLEEFVVGKNLSPARLEKILKARNVEGLLIAPQGGFSLDWKGFPWKRFSVVRLGRLTAEPITHVVTADQAANAMLAFREIRARGYQRVAFVGDSSPEKLFGAGFFWAQSRVSADLRLPPFFIDPRGDVDIPDFHFWLSRTKPDAIFMEDPRIPKLLSDAGIRVPEDIGLAATTLLDTPVSAGIDQNSLEIGRIAVSVLVSLIHDRARGLPSITRNTLVNGRWIDGASLSARSI